MRTITDYCADCGGFVVFDTEFVLASNPPKYRGDCMKCGKVHYRDTRKLDRKEPDHD